MLQNYYEEYLHYHVLGNGILNLWNVIVIFYSEDVGKEA